MKQPLAGVTATLLIAAVALIFISFFPFATFSGWVGYLIDCIIPMQVIVGVVWEAKHPAYVASKPQPVRGILLVLITLLAGAVCAVLFWQTIGHGLNPPTPILIFFVIEAVLSTFWLCIMFGGWPFVNIFKNMVTAGIAILVAAELLSFIILRVFFDFGFMRGAPFFRESDPHGMFNAWSALVYYVTMIAAMFFVACFDLWPLHLNPSLMKQPVLGICWTLLSAVIAGIVFYIGIYVMHMDVVNFMVRVPIPFIFGTIVVLNMMQRSLFSSLKPPLKGVANVILVALVGSVLARIYLMIMPSVSGSLNAGPPAYDQEIWLASALLSVTFPTLVAFAEFFKLWPLRKTEQAS